MATKRKKDKPAPTMLAVWETISSWLTVQQKKNSMKLPPGASEGELQLAEVALGVTFPKLLRESYSIHNGTGSIALLQFGEWDLAYPLLSLYGMVGRWKNIQDNCLRGGYEGPAFVSNPSGPIKKQPWLNQKWIPIVDTQGGDYYFVDLAPAKGGSSGQIIDFLREDGAKNVIATDLLDLLATLANDLEAGKYTFDEKNHAVRRNDKDSSN